MEHVLDDFDFLTADKLVERLQYWATSPDLGIAYGTVIYVEDGQGDIMHRAVLLESTLTDGSKVYTVRLS